MAAAKSQAGDAGERLFERYLDEQGYEWEHHPELGTTKRPDYLVRANGYTVICEVKTFNVTEPFAHRSSSGLAGARSMKEVLTPHRNDIREAASQLKELHDSGWPLVVVLANPLGCLVPTDPWIVASAMYGDPELSAPLLDDGSIGEFTTQAGRNGKLTMDHQYISAVAVLRRQSHVSAWGKQWVAEHKEQYADVETLVAAFLDAAQIEAPQGDSVSLDIIETISDQAIALPREVFNDQRDRRFALNEAGTAITELSF